MGSKKKQTTTSNNTQTNAPPAWTLPGLTSTAGLVTDAVKQVQGVGPYTGDFTAQPNSGLVDAAMAGYTGAAGAVPGNLMQLQSISDRIKGVQPVTTGTYDVGGAYDVNPAISAATAPIFRQLTEGTLPGLRSAALDSGAYSGDRAMSVIPQAVIGQSLRDAQDVAATIGLQDYQAREARRLQAYGVDQANSLEAQQFNNNYALQSGQQLADLVNQDMMLRSSVGDLNQAALGLDMQRQQAGIDNDLQKYDASLKYPFRGLDIASALLAQLSGNYGTQTSNGTQTQVQTSSGLGNVVQGIAGLAGMIGSLPMGGGGSLGGQLLGSLFKKGG
jgi:hypothetical protein